ncbi:hypothetical protein GZ77_19365 [Endozoicomonas montiporae]|uniref:Methylated-DNA--protein-cysteine methyltransferase n=3 Tax=Endozoicomonas montiporae TaxID=1027273 RepID=A0A081N2I3_9GAMM|nr:methylated-DNA--protein-cysteine methyltransferase [Endozoicomonas montiporae CL-33]KEQ12656.1 hypothetical protein GZ77_19365 [Endozoicomonas montiporae]
MTLFHKYLNTPVGRFKLVADQEHLLAGYWVQSADDRSSFDLSQLSDEHPILNRAGIEMQEYMQGKRRSFDVPVKPEGTLFQKQVWQKLLEIPYGATVSYSELASSINNPKASRAVGAAVGKNPLLVFIPCHRVIGSSGALTGYAGGLEAKKWLLTLENP